MVRSSKFDNKMYVVSEDWKCIQLSALDYTRLPFYEVNLWVFPIAYHRLDIQLHS